jgi:hypothetical protein
MVEYEHYRQMANGCSPVSGQPRSRIYISLDITEFSLCWWQCQLTLIFSMQWDIKGQHPFIQRKNRQAKVAIFMLSC